MKKETLLPLTVQMKSARVRYSAFAVGGAKKGTLSGESHNCDTADGVLTSGLGLTQVCAAGTVLPQHSTFFPLVGYDENGNCVETVGALSLNGEFFIYQNNVWVRKHTFTKPMRAVRVVNDEAKIQTVLIGQEGLYLYVYGEELQAVNAEDFGEKAHLSCFAQGRLFYVEAPYTLRFSKAYEPMNFTQSIDDGGGVCLPSVYGEAVDLVAAEDKVYVVYEKGIAVVNVRGSACDFTIREIEYRGSRILQGSVGAWGTENKKLFFLTEQGVCRLHGNRVERVGKNLAIYPKRGTQVCEHGFFEGKYAVGYCEEDGTWRCTVVDGETGEGYFTSTLYSLSEYKGGMLCYFNGGVWEAHRCGSLPEGETHTFTVSGITLETSGRKCLKALEIEGFGTFELEVENGKKSKRFSVDCTLGGRKIPVRMHGESFTFRLQLSDTARIYALTADVVKLAAVR